MAKEQVTTNNAPKAAVEGLYSQGIKAGGLLFISGQLPIEENGNQIKDDIKAAVTMCLKNICSVAAAAGAGKGDMVKLTMLLADLNDFDAANEAYIDFFKGTVPPARTAFQVARLPRNAIVEIEAIASLA